MNRIFFTISLIVLTLASINASAHHSFSATFSAGDKITVEGVVTEWSFKNPHVLVYFDVTNDDGTVTNWVSEGAAATNMRRNGWSADTFTPGEIVRITGDRTHDGSPMTSIDTVLVLNANGEIVRELGEEETQVTGDDPENVADVNAMGGMGAMGAGPQESFVKAAPMDLTLADGRPNLTGAWTRHGMGLGRPAAPTATFNEIGQAAQALFALEIDPQVFCDAPGLMRQAGMTPHPVRITQFDDRVEFAWEEYGGSRTVYFDDRDAKGYKTRLGDGIARYEDGALIIETTNLLSNPSSPEGQLLSDNATITEIYTRVDDDKYGPVLRIQAIGKDPDWVEGEMIFDGRKMSAGEYEFIENDCQPPLRERVAVHPSTSFFITSTGLGDGANLGGLEGADAHCEALATQMNIGGKGWRAYLSTTGEGGVNARDRIGNGPWYNASGEVVAADIENLHSENNMLTRASGLSERAGVVPARGDEVNKHDILTGSTLDGFASDAEGDTTCGNWTSNSEEGSALVGHFDREGGGDNPTSWNQAHASRGCSQENLQGTGGDGLFYCFASIENTTAVDVNNIIPVIGYDGTQSRPNNPAPNAMAAPELQAGAASSSVASSGIAEEASTWSPLVIAAIVAALLIIGVLLFRGSSG